MEYKIYSFLLPLFLLVASYSYTGGVLIMQCEFSDFFQDIKISGAIGFKSEHSLAKRVHADTTMVGLIYHPLIGLRCGALPTSTKDDEKKKGVARGLALMWPLVLNGVRDRAIQDYQDMVKKMSATPVYPIKKDYTDVIAATDIVLSDHADDSVLIQKMYNTIQRNAVQAVDKKQKEMLQRQAERLAVYLERNKHKGIS